VFQEFLSRYEYHFFQCVNKNGPSGRFGQFLYIGDH
jgi:hypothetical protein